MERVEHMLLFSRYARVAVACLSARCPTRYNLTWKILVGLGTVQFLERCLCEYQLARHSLHRNSISSIPSRYLVHAVSLHLQLSLLIG